VLRAFRSILLQCALNEESVAIRGVGKFVPRQRRKYKGMSRVTNRPFGQRTRFGLFFQSSESFDDALVRKLKQTRKFPYPKTPDGAYLQGEEALDRLYYGNDLDR